MLVAKVTYEDFISHPFELNFSDLKAANLELEQQMMELLTDEEQEQVKGGIRVTTNYVTAKVGEAGEEGGGPVATTHYITATQGEAAEEGGGQYM